MKTFVSALLFFVVFLAAGLIREWIGGEVLTSAELARHLATALIAAVIYGGVARLLESRGKRIHR